MTMGLALYTLMTTIAATSPAAVRTPGPAGSVLIVEESQTTPLVHVVLATRTGSANDPRGMEGLANLAGELARRGAAGKTREQLDDALDALGANLDVIVDADTLRFTGMVLARNLDAFLDLLADVILRPDFTDAELARTKREVLGQLDEMRNDDRALCGRYFDQRLYGDHPYGRAPDGTVKSLARIRRADVVNHFRRMVVGRNLVFGFAGGVTTVDVQAKLNARFTSLKEGPVPDPPAVSPPHLPTGWRIQIVDKPDRQQTQIMFGHAGVPARDPDFLPLTIGLASFGGRGMKATLMDEVRTKRGLAYGAYLSPSARRGPGPVRGWVNTGSERTVTTLKLVLRLYRQLMKKGVDAERVKFFQDFMVGSFASDMDAPHQRLGARVAAEVQGLPPDHVDTYVARLRAVTPAQVNEALKRHVRADNLAITMVATASEVTRRLTAAKVDPGAIDIVPFDAY